MITLQARVLRAVAERPGTTQDIVIAARPANPRSVGQILHSLRVHGLVRFAEPYTTPDEHVITPAGRYVLDHLLP